MVLAGPTETTDCEWSPRIEIEIGLSMTNKGKTIVDELKNKIITWSSEDLNTVKCIVMSRVSYRRLGNLKGHFAWYD